MAAWLADLASRFGALSAAEGVAIAMAIAYLVLAIRQSIWCWPCACISTAIYVHLFIDARLYMESVLNLFYLGMAVYGWYAWLQGRHGETELPVTSWAFRRHAIAIGLVALVATLNGYLLQRYSDAVYPYVDSMTTWGAIWATWLVARKILENWVYWLVIDGASVAIYWLRGLEHTAALYLLYVLLIPVGYLSWRRAMLASQA